MSADEGEMSIGPSYREKSEREKQIYINTCMWNLEKWFIQTYLQGRNRDAGVEKGLVDTVGEGEGEMN